MAKSSVTIRDIAEKLEVSSSLVSIVLSGKGKQKRIKPDTINRIEKAALDMGYKPNLQARALRTNRSGLIALVVPDISNHFFARMSKRMEELSFSSDYELLIGSFDEDKEKFRRLIERFIGVNVEGMIITPQISSTSIIKEIKKSGIPFVFIDRYLSDLESTFVVSDNKTAAMTLTQALILQGAKKIAAVTYSFKSTAHSDRIEGYWNTLKENNIYQDEYVFSISPQNLEEEMNLAIEKILSLNIDAIFFTNNALGVLGLKILTKLGYKIPKDIKVACFDNVDSFQLFAGGLWCAEQNLEVMCDHSFEILLNMISGLNVLQNYFVPVRIIPPAKQNS
ncbi:MAG: LacI family DNA-binding transcriptional regulator [Bacteroidales bacterium]|nr:LacI family DNA-binding transcriptional regulator [Bacteroidales bacterium]